MLLTIHNLPIRIEYSDIKMLLASKCGLDDCILDNLENEGGGMRVTVGVGEEEDAAILVRKINGIYFRGQQLYVQDKRQKKESEQPYRTPMTQQLPFQMQQLQPAFDCTAQMQSMGMYNIAMFQPQPGIETMQNPYMAYGGHQAHPIIAPSGQFGEYSQQPFIAAPEPAKLFVRRSPTPNRNQRDEDRWDAGRNSCDDMPRSISPDSSGPSWAPRIDEPFHTSDYQGSRSSRIERPSRSRGLDRMQDRFGKRGPPQHNLACGGTSPRSGESARGARGGRGGHFSSARGGHASNVHDPRGGHFGDTRSGQVPNVQDSRSGNFYNTHGDYAPNAQEFRSGNFGNARDGYAPNAPHSQSGNIGNTHGDYAPNAQELRSGNFGNARDGYAPNVPHSQSGNFGNIRGGYAPNVQEPRSGNFGNIRGGYAPNVQEPRSGNFGNIRGGHAPNELHSRSDNFGNIGGGYAPNTQDTRSDNFGNIGGGYAPNAQDTRSGSFKNIRADDASNAQDPRSVNFSNTRGGHVSNAAHSRSGNFGNTRDGYAPNGQDPRSANFGNTRGGHVSHAPHSRSGNFGNTRGGYAPNAYDSRTANFSNTLGDHVRDDCSRDGNTLKRRGEELNCHEQMTQQENDEPRPKKFAPNPTRPEPECSKLQTKHTPSITSKLFKTTIDRASGKIMFEIAKTLNIIRHLAAGASPLKKLLRMFVTKRVYALAGGPQPLSPEDIVARYRAKYPPSDDLIVYDVIKKEITDVRTKKERKEAARMKHVPYPRPNKIPSYILGDKKIHSQQRLQDRKTIETLDAVPVDLKYQKAINEEVELIGTLIEDGIKYMPNQSDRDFFLNRDPQDFVNQCKKLIAYHLSRRLTNTGLKQLYIHGRPKAPRRPALEEFLAKYDCLSLKKLLKSPVYIATFETYDTLEKLAAMDPVVIGDSLVNFKNFNLAPRKPRFNQKQAKNQRMKYVRGLIQESNVNLLSKDWQIQEEEERKATGQGKIEDSETTGSDDVIYVKGTDVDFTVDITEDDDSAKKQNKTEEEKKVSVEENHDFLHRDFKVIDEVRESDNDEVGNDAPTAKGNVKAEVEIKDDWGDTQTGEDWGNIGEVNDGNGNKGDNGNKNDVEDCNDDTKDNKDDNYGSRDEKGDNHDTKDSKDDNDDKNGDEDGNGGGETENSDNEDDEGDYENEHMGGFNAADIDLDDIDEGDLEDY